MLYSFRACYTKAVSPVSQVTEAGVEDKRPYNEGETEKDSRCCGQCICVPPKTSILKFQPGI